MNNQIPKKIELTSHFKLIFIAIFIFTLLSLIISFYLAFEEPMNPAQTKLFSSCDMIMKTGFGAIVGLIGGKTI